MKKVLVVDDSKAARVTLRKPLEDAGLMVLESCSAEDALNVIRTLDDALGLIITDHNMPGVSGLEMVMRLRSEPSGLNYRTPVFFLTSDSSVITKEQSIALNVKAVILKPVNPAALVEAVKKVVGLK